MVRGRKREAGTGVPRWEGKRGRMGRGIGRGEGGRGEQGAADRRSRREEVSAGVSRLERRNRRYGRAGGEEAIVVETMGEREDAVEKVEVPSVEVEL